MRTVNRTVYSTHKLRRFISEVLRREEFPSRLKRGLVVEICYTVAAGTFSGGAVIGGNVMVLRLPRDLGKRETDLPNLGFLIAHEARHIEGRGHRDMPPYVNHWDNHMIGKHWGWAREYPIPHAVAAWRRRKKTLPKKRRL